MSKNNILLESGTNELELLEFKINNVYFGINVMKVREVINFTEATRVPESHPCIEGVIKLRGEVITLIDLIKYLNYPSSEDTKEDKIIITEFNQSKTAFHVNEVTRIHRISWEQIHKAPDMVQGENTCIIGMVKMDNRIIQMLDFEKIMVDIDPSSVKEGIKTDNNRAEKQSDKNIMIVEDSPTLRQILTDYLPKIGYPNLHLFENGALAWDYLENLVNEKQDQFINDINLVITDIEMPRMDGHHLTRKIKEHDLLKQLPVIIFSSLITEDLIHKGKSVGVDAQISKPNFRDLSKIIEQLIF